MVHFYNRIAVYEYRRNVHTAEVRKQIHQFMSSLGGDHTPLPDILAYLYPWAIPEQLADASEIYPRHIIEDAQLATELAWFSQAHGAELDWDKLRKSGYWVYEE